MKEKRGYKSNNFDHFIYNVGREMFDLSNDDNATLTPKEYFTIMNFLHNTIKFKSTINKGCYFLVGVGISDEVSEMIGDNLSVFFENMKYVFKDFGDVQVCSYKELEKYASSQKIDMFQKLMLIF